MGANGAVESNGHVGTATTTTTTTGTELEGIHEKSPLLGNGDSVNTGEESSKKSLEDEGDPLCNNNSMENELHKRNVKSGTTSTTATTGDDKNGNHGKNDDDVDEDNGKSNEGEDFGLHAFNSCHSHYHGLLKLTDMPAHLQFNRHVHSGYRALHDVWGCFWSLFYLHNETVNIFTHGEF